MGHVLYKDHTIVNTARPFSRRDVGFIAAAEISWRTRTGISDVHLLSLTKLYPTKEEASTAALEVAKAWVDRHSLDVDYY
jgi:hypothetical protein